MSFEITGILAKVGPPLLIHISKVGIEKLFDHPPVSKAIDSTYERFVNTDIEGIRDALNRWCQSERFL